MEFTFETTYNQKAVTAMAKALRKTIRRKRSRRSHIFGWIIIVLALLLTLLPGENGFEITFKTIVTWLATLVMLMVLIWEDALNGYIARKRMLPGTEKNTTVFNQEGYYSTSEFGKSEWKYDKVHRIVEWKRYFVFIFSENHAQVYDKEHLSGGSADEFCQFIEEMTGKMVESICFRTGTRRP